MVMWLFREREHKSYLFFNELSVLVPHVDILQISCWQIVTPFFPCYSHQINPPICVLVHNLISLTFSFVTDSSSYVQALLDEWISTRTFSDKCLIQVLEISDFLLYCRTVHSWTVP